MAHAAVAESVHIPKERKPEMMARLTQLHAAESQEAYVLREMEKDASEAVKMLEDHGQVTLLSPRVRHELRRMAVSRREAVGEEGYVRSREYVDLLGGEKLKLMTPEALDAAMSGGEHEWEWKQAGVFHKALAADYLALKQGKEKLDDPVRQLALEAAIDRYVPDMDEGWRAGQMRLMIREGFGEEKEGELMERLEARVKGKAKVPAVTARAREELYHWARQNGGGGGVNGEDDGRRRRRSPSADAGRSDLQWRPCSFLPWKVRRVQGLRPIRAQREDNLWQFEFLCCNAVEMMPLYPDICRDDRKFRSTILMRSGKNPASHSPFHA